MLKSGLFYKLTSAWTDDYQRGKGNSYFNVQDFQNRDSSVTLFLQNDNNVILSEAKNLIYEKVR